MQVRQLWDDQHKIKCLTWTLTITRSFRVRHTKGNLALTGSYFQTSDHFNVKFKRFHSSNKNITKTSWWDIYIHVSVIYKDTEHIKKTLSHDITHIRSLWRFENNITRLRNFSWKTSLSMLSYSSCMVNSE